MRLYNSGGGKLQGSVLMTGWKNLPQGVRAFGHGPLQRRETAMQGWGHTVCLVLLPGDGAAGGLTCRSCTVPEAWSDQVPELWEEPSSLDSIGNESSSLPSDVNLQNQYNALIAKEGELVPWGKPGTLINTKAKWWMFPSAGQEDIDQSCSHGILTICWHCREAPSSYTPSSSLSLFMGVNTNDHKQRHGTKSTRDCRFLWPKKESPSAVLFNCTSVWEGFG